MKIVFNEEEFTEIMIETVCEMLDIDERDYDFDTSGLYMTSCTIEVSEKKETGDDSDV